MMHKAENVSQPSQGKYLCVTAVIVQSVEKGCFNVRFKVFSISAAKLPQRVGKIHTAPEMMNSIDQTVKTMASDPNRTYQSLR